MFVLCNILDFRCSVPQDCNDNGVCDEETRKCDCNDNWDSMEDCSGKLLLNFLSESVMRETVQISFQNKTSNQIFLLLMVTFITMAITMTNLIHMYYLKLRILGIQKTYFKSAFEHQIL